MKSPKNKIAKNPKNKVAIKGRRADFLKSHPKQALIDEATVKKICKDIGQWRAQAKKWGGDGLSVLNRAHDIGVFVNVYIDSFPGKQLSLDFWEQIHAVFVDQFGQSISREQLIWFANHAKRNPDPITDINVMLSYRREVLSQVDLILEGERVGGNPTDANFYNKALIYTDAKKFGSIIDHLESDPRFGPIETWPEERKERFWLQFEPFLTRALAVGKLLKPAIKIPTPPHMANLRR